MNVLPLIHRELLVGSRKRSTHWLRLGVTMGALLVAAMYLFAIYNTRGMTGISPGQWLFLVLSWMSLAITGLFGVFFAADAISEERREGTLGLLFLTPLNGFDVILGKLVSICVRTGYALLAALPVLALPLLLGGVTFTSYFRVAVALGGTMFLSSALGLLISAISRDSTRAIVVTLLAIMTLTGLPLLIDFNANRGAATFTPYTSPVSPGYALYLAASGRAPGLWTALGIQHGLAWLALLLAAVRTAQFTDAAPIVKRTKARDWLAAEGRRSRQNRLRERSPVAWFVQRRSRGPVIVALIVLIGFAANLVLRPDQYGGPGGMFFGAPVQFASPLFYFVLLLWLTVFATRRTGEARRQGELELLLATPLSATAVARGHWHGLVRVFLVPALIAAALVLAAALVQLSQMKSLYANNPGGSESTQFISYFLINAGFSTLGVFTTLAALGWMGLWLGLTGENTAAAAAKTFLIVVVGSAIGIQLCQILWQLTANQIFGPSSVGVLPLSAVVRGGLSIAADLAFILWARRRLLTHFREAANGTYARRKLSIGRRLATPATGNGN